MNIFDQTLQRKPPTAHEAYLDQVALDKLNGLEEGKICRKVYREKQHKTAARWEIEKAREAEEAAKRAQRGSVARSKDTYRSVRRKVARGVSRARLAKAERIMLGQTRAEHANMARVQIETARASGNPEVSLPQQHSPPNTYRGGKPHNFARECARRMRQRGARL